MINQENLTCDCRRKGISNCGHSIWVNDDGTLKVVKREVYFTKFEKWAQKHLDI